MAYFKLLFMSLAFFSVIFMHNASAVCHIPNDHSTLCLNHVVYVGDQLLYGARVEATTTNQEEVTLRSVLSGERFTVNRTEVYAPAGEVDGVCFEDLVSHDSTHFRDARVVAMNLHHQRVLIRSKMTGRLKVVSPEDLKVITPLGKCR